MSTQIAVCRKSTLDQLSNSHPTSQHETAFTMVHLYEIFVSLIFHFYSRAVNQLFSKVWAQIFFWLSYHTLGEAKIQVMILIQIGEKQQASKTKMVLKL